VSSRYSGVTSTSFSVSCDGSSTEVKTAARSLGWDAQPDRCPAPCGSAGRFCQAKSAFPVMLSEPQDADQRPALASNGPRDTPPKYNLFVFTADGAAAPG